MKQVITGWDHLFGPWLAEKTNGGWQAGRGSTIGLFDPGKGIRAATWFTDWNGASVILHCAGEGKDWLNREFLWFVFHYAFNQLNVTKIISPVESGNSDCKKFIEHLGFSLEATLKDACPNGNMLLYTMEKKQCRWLSLEGQYRGKTKGASSAGLQGRS